MLATKTPYNCRRCAKGLAESHARLDFLHWSQASACTQHRKQEVKTFPQLNLIYRRPLGSWEAISPQYPAFPGHEPIQALPIRISANGCGWAMSCRVTWKSLAKMK